MNEIQLNHEQLQLKEILSKWLNNSNKDFYGILGAGGVGKTTVICNVLANYRNNVVFLGATNKVISVLKDGLSRNKFENPKIKTIDSFLGFRILKDHENNSTITYRLPSVKSLPELIVIDEISMITYQKFEQILKLSKHCKIILLGDHLQLPPIEEEKHNSIRNDEGFKVSRIFTLLNKENSFTLTIQNRQKTNSEMGALISNFRKFMHVNINPKSLAHKKSNGVDILNFKVNDKSLKEFIKQNDSTAVCYKNLTVMSMNWLIGSTKSMRKDYRLNEINVGDELLFDAFYSYKDDAFYTSNLVEVIFIKKNVEEEFIVKSNIVKKIIFNEITVATDFNELKIIRYIHGGLYGENGGGLSSSVYGQRKTYLEHIRKGKNAAENIKYLSDLNTRFSDYQNSFAKLKRPYGISCHKAQGSTYNNVIIPIWDYYALNFQDANQLLYVAMSRAKEKLIFVDKDENFKDNSKRYCFSEFEKQAIASSYNYKCANCRVDLVEREFDCDHKIPISVGGKNSIENLQPLCKRCHLFKSAKEK